MLIMTKKKEKEREEKIRKREGREVVTGLVRTAKICTVPLASDHADH